MTRVFLGIGSNIQAASNIQRGLQRLGQNYQVVDISPCYQSPAHGFSGDDFWNLAVEIEVADEQTPTELSAELKQLEYDFGRAPDAPKYSARYLDIDILLFGEQVGEFGTIQLPRVDIWQYAFVLKPLLDIYPNGECPKSRQALSAYWPLVADQPLMRLMHQFSVAC